MAATRYNGSDLRRQLGSPRQQKTPRADSKDTLCRNVMIYGYCRYEDQGCAFNHDPKLNSTQKSPNVESPTFAPAQPSAMKKSTFSTQAAASAAVFTPRNVGSGSGGSSTPSGPSTATPEPDASAFNLAAREFTPSISYDGSNNSVQQNGAASNDGSYDAYSMSSVGQSLPQTQYNPYADENNALANPPFYAGQSSYGAPAPPANYHLYTSMGPYREDLLGYQKHAHDFFMSEKLREDCQKKIEAAHQTLANVQLPQVDVFHSLVPLDTNHRKNAVTFGYPSWLYKAKSTRNGRLYALRRLEGYKLTSEQALRTVKEWKRVNCANVVSLHEAITTRVFGDSSLVFVQDYHPLSKTLMEVHFANTHPSRYGRGHVGIQEAVLWGYVVQFCNVIKSVHNASLAVRCWDLSKIIVTDKNRIRMSGCGILDVTQFEHRRSLQELQQEDFALLGKTLLSLATNTPPTHIANLQVAINQMAKTYSNEFRDIVTWLLTPVSATVGTPQPKTAESLLRAASPHIMDSFDMALHSQDSLTSELFKELENGRISRTLLKMNVVNERPEYETDRAWSETGERYMVRLFRDHVFHQVDAQGRPVIDIGHMLSCLARLDAGTDERFQLVSRDEQTSFLLSFREMKKQFQAAFAEVLKASTGPPRNTKPPIPTAPSTATTASQDHQSQQAQHQAVAAGGAGGPGTLAQLQAGSSMTAAAAGAAMAQQQMQASVGGMSTQQQHAQHQHQQMMQGQQMGVPPQGQMPTGPMQNNPQQHQFVQGGMAPGRQMY